MDLERRVREFLAERQQSGFGGSFHTPEPGVLVARSSAYHALILEAFDPAAALAELRALYAACQTEEGLVGARRLRDAGAPEQPLLIDPPVAAWAAARLAPAAGDEALLARATRQLDAIWAERLPPDSSLPVLLHPSEAAVPGSPTYDSVIESTLLEEWEDEAGNLARSANACQLDPERALRAGHSFVVEDPGFCGWFLMALEQARDAWERIGDATVARKLAIRADMIAEGIAERLWWPDQEIYVPRNRARDEQMCVVGVAGLLPAATRKLLEESEAKRAIDRHLRPSASPLWGQRGISLNPILKDRGWDPDGVRERGNVATPLAHYWAHLTLTRAGRASDARVARAQLEELIENHGLVERFDPDGGSPLEPDRLGTLGGLAVAMTA